MAGHCLIEVYAVLILTANLVEFIALLRRWKFVPSTIFLLNLCICDFLIGLFLGIVEFLDYFNSTALLSKQIVSYVFLRLVMLMSGISLIIIAIDRLTAANKPFVYRKIKNRDAVLICIFPWFIFTIILFIIFAVGYMFRGDINYHYINLFYPIVTFITSLVLVPSYCKIIHILKQQQKRTTPLMNSVSPTTTAPQSTTMMNSTSIEITITTPQVSVQTRTSDKKSRNSQRNTRFIKLTIAIISVYIVCSFPFAIYCIPRVLGHVNFTVLHFLFYLTALNALIDPLLYFHYVRKRIWRAFGYFIRYVIGQDRRRRLTDSGNHKTNVVSSTHALDSEASPSLLHAKLKERKTKLTDDIFVLRRKKTLIIR